ncbi:MAG: hypothetical protein FWG87_04565 [Defluviitaleaceae bacterium]|nr:hypothetical protein [Defluviitaleaceae bacterium]
MKIFVKFAFPIIILFSGLTVFAYDVNVNTTGENVGETIGYVINIHGDILHIDGEPLTVSDFSNVLVNIARAPIYDLRTGFRVLSQSIREDTALRVAYEIGGGEPFPAVAAWLNWDDDDAAAFTVEVSESISAGYSDTAFLSADGKYRVTLTPETLIFDPFHGILSPSDIVHGMELFVWVDMITASTPALVYPDKVVVVY